MIGWHGDLPEILVVPLTQPLVQYGESSLNDPQRPVPSAASRVFGCDADRKTVHGMCRQIVKARCSCVGGSAFPEWLATNCRGLDYLHFATNPFFEEEEAIIHCLVHATKALLLTSLQHCQITEADVMVGKTDQDDPSVLRIAASLAAWSKSKGQATESVSDDADVIDSESDLENSDIDSEWDS